MNKNYKAIAIANYIVEQDALCFEETGCPMGTGDLRGMIDCDDDFRYLYRILMGEEIEHGSRGLETLVFKLAHALVEEVLG